MNKNLISPQRRKGRKESQNQRYYLINFAFFASLRFYNFLYMNKKTILVLSAILSFFTLFLYESGGPAFAEEEELEKRKVEFETQAKKRFTDDFWTPLPKNPPLSHALREFPKGCLWLS